MSRGSTLVLIGALTVLTQFSGLPIAIRTFLTIAFGIIVFGMGASIRARDARAAHPAAAPIQPEPIAPAAPDASEPPHGVSPI